MRSERMLTVKFWQWKAGWILDLDLGPTTSMLCFQVTHRAISVDANDGPSRSSSIQ